MICQKPTERPVVQPGETTKEYQRRYHQWWRNTDKGKAAGKKYAQSDKGKAAGKTQPSHIKFTNEHPMGVIKCVECGSSYDHCAAIALEYRRIGRFHCICDMCA